MKSVFLPACLLAWPGLAAGVDPYVVFALAAGPVGPLAPSSVQQRSSVRCAALRCAAVSFTACPCEHVYM